jgi:hypothetical protein
LGERLGLAFHESPLRFKIRRLMGVPVVPGRTEEDWLVSVANQRGLRVVFPATPWVVRVPAPQDFSDEELVAALCLLQSRDRPQILRLAAQRISRGALDLARLVRLAVMEHSAPVLRELCIQALRVEPAHPYWRALSSSLPPTRPLREPLLHWTRLAEPIMQAGQPNAHGWKLVA